MRESKEYLLEQFRKLAHGEYYVGDNRTFKWTDNNVYRWIVAGCPLVSLRLTLCRAQSNSLGTAQDSPARSSHGQGSPSATWNEASSRGLQATSQEISDSYEEQPQFSLAQPAHRGPTTRRSWPLSPWSILEDYFQTTRWRASHHNRPMATKPTQKAYQPLLGTQKHSSSRGLH